MKRTIFSMMALLLGSITGCGSSTTTTGPCATVTCATNQFCDAASGACKSASACAGVTCAAGTVCDGSSTSATSGMCVAATCGTTMCTGGQVCSASATCVNPGVPALATQIDRMGRPAINTALTNPYDIYKPVAGGNPEPGDITKDHYNHDANQAMWVANWAPTMAAHIAVLDGLDGGVCGNSIAFGALAQANYITLSQLLAGDAVLVDSTQGTCATYLGVELKALGKTITDCGGRQLSYDVIDSTYTALSNGNAATPTVVTDGVVQTTAPSATFPFFTAPQ